jgi:hypothetical protein
MLQGRCALGINCLPSGSWRAEVNDSARYGGITVIKIFVWKPGNLHPFSDSYSVRSHYARTRTGCSDISLESQGWRSDVVTRLRTEQPRNKWLDSQQEQGIFLFSRACWPAVGPCSVGAGGSFPSIKAADHLTCT